MPLICFYSFFLKKSYLSLILLRGERMSLMFYSALYLVNPFDFIFKMESAIISSFLANFLN